MRLMIVSALALSLLASSFQQAFCACCPLKGKKKQSSPDAPDDEDIESSPLYNAAHKNNYTKQLKELLSSNKLDMMAIYDLARVCLYSKTFLSQATLSDLKKVLPAEIHKEVVVAIENGFTISNAYKKVVLTAAEKRINDAESYYQKNEHEESIRLSLSPQPKQSKNNVPSKP